LFEYSATSRSQLETCDERIQLTFNEALRLQVVDIKILKGHRGTEEQQRMFHEGLSELDGITRFSKHQSYPSLAVDAAALPLVWTDHSRFTMFAGFIIGIAASNGIIMRSGTDWNRNFSTKDHKFFDGPHFEIVEGVTS